MLWYFGREDSTEMKNDENSRLLTRNCTREGGDMNINTKIFNNASIRWLAELWGCLRLEPCVVWWMIVGVQLLLTLRESFDMVFFRNRVWRNVTLSLDPRFCGCVSSLAVFSLTIGAKKGNITRDVTTMGARRCAATRRTETRHRWRFNICHFSLI